MSPTATAAAPLPRNPVPAPHLRAATGAVDLAAAEAAAADFIRALGLDPDSAHVAATPRRMARAWAELITPEPFDLTTFPNDEGYDELVLVRDIAFRSICEHHFLPFSGHACVAYRPGEEILGLSKLARVVEHVSAGPQTQERLTSRVADWLHQTLAPRSVGVVIAAEHTCMSLRGVRSVGAATVTSAFRGGLRTDSSARREFLALAGRPGGHDN